MGTEDAAATFDLAPRTTGDSIVVENDRKFALAGVVEMVAMIGKITEALRISSVDQRLVRWLQYAAALK